MKSMNRAFLIVAVIAIMTLSFMKPATAAGATIAINPTVTALSQAQVGETFKVNITVNDVTNLWDWKVRLNWNPQVLNLTNVEEGPFLKSGGLTLFTWPEGAQQINEGYLPEIYCASFVPSGVNGSGVLATVTFKVLTTGASTVTMNETWLNTFSDPIVHTVVDGYVVIPVTFSALGQDIQVSSNSTITDFQFSEASKKIGFNVSGSDGTKGFANITFPKALLSGDLAVYLDQVPLTNGVGYTMTSDATQFTFSLTYSHSMHKIEIVGAGTPAAPEETPVTPPVTPDETPVIPDENPPVTPDETPLTPDETPVNPVIPEFPSMIVFPLVIFIAAVAVLVTLKKRNDRKHK